MFYTQPSGKGKIECKLCGVCTKNLQMQLMPWAQYHNRQTIKSLEKVGPNNTIKIIRMIQIIIPEAERWKLLQLTTQALHLSHFLPLAFTREVSSHDMFYYLFFMTGIHDNMAQYLLCTKKLNERKNHKKYWTSMG